MYQTFLAVVEVKKVNSGTAILPESVILEICCFSAFGDVEYTF